MGQWAGELDAVAERIASRFRRSEPRRRAAGYVCGLLGDAERKNGWQLAGHLGEANPDGVQHLLARAGWDADAVRDDLTGYVAEHLGDAGGVLVVDETGFLKRRSSRAGWPASTPALPAVSRTPRWAFPSGTRTERGKP